MQKYQKNVLQCTAIVKVLPMIIAKRQSVFRSHIDRQSQCKAREYKAKLVMQGRMGSYASFIKRLSNSYKLLETQKAEVKDNKKQFNGLENQQKKINNFINNLKFKQWRLQWNMYQIRLLDC